MVKTYFHRVFTAGVVALLAGCAGMQGSAPPTSLKLSSGARQLLEWRQLVEADTSLGKECLVSLTGTERARRFEGCFAAPLREHARNVGFPLMRPLESYLAGVRKEVEDQVVAERPEKDFLLRVASHRDGFLVTMHRYVAEHMSMFDGPGVAYVVDKDVTLLKVPTIEQYGYVANSNLNRLMGAYQMLLTERARSAVAAKAGAVPADFSAKLDMDATGKRLLNETYYRYLTSFFTNEDLRRYNTLYAGEDGKVLQMHEQLAITGLFSLQEELTKRKMVKGLAQVLQKYSESAEKSSGSGSREPEKKEQRP